MRTPYDTQANARETREANAQLDFLLTQHVLDGDTAVEFEQADPATRKAVVRAVVEARCQQMAEASHIPWQTDALGDLSYNALLDFAETLAGQTETEYDDPCAVMESCGLPLRDDVVDLREYTRKVNNPQPALAGSPEAVQAMREAGVPTVDGEPDRRRLSAEAALIDGGIPLRQPEPITVSFTHNGLSEAAQLVEALHEAAAASSAPALVRGDAPHETVAQLAVAVPMAHPDRAAVNRLVRHGAALSADDRDEVGQLAAKHLDPLDDEDREDFDDLNDDDQPESASSLSSGTKQTRPASSRSEANTGDPNPQASPSVGSLNLTGSALAEALVEAEIPWVDGAGMPRRTSKGLTADDLLRDMEIPMRGGE